MNIPQKIYEQIQGFSFADRAIILALAAEYLENGSVSYDQKGSALDFFNSIRQELDRTIRRRAYARAYRAKKKAEKTKPEISHNPATPDLPESSDNSDTKIPFLNRRERRFLERRAKRFPHNFLAGKREIHRYAVRGVGRGIG